MEVKKMFTANIKPSSPTPLHLKHHRLSILDQTFRPFYVPLVLFFTNNQKTISKEIISDRLNNLRLSLANTLTQFYTFSGRLEDDDLYIDCNDEGVYYVEAAVNNQLPDFLTRRDEQLIYRLAPENPIPLEESTTSGKYVLLIQVNVFECGGIAIGVCASHKTIDANTYMTFMKTWATSTAQGSNSEDMMIYPSFAEKSLFPQNPSLSYTWPPIYNEGKYVTRRFVFDASALSSLKSKVVSASSKVKKPSRVDAVSALVWKCAMEAATKARPHSQNKHSVLALTLDLRRRNLPPLPSYAVGNFIWYAFPRCVQNYSKVEMSELVDFITEEIAKINSDFIEEIKGNEGFQKISDGLKKSVELLESTEKGNCIYLTSLCNYGIYETDFGWGKPEWFCFCSPTFASLIMLTDTRYGAGIEASVTLPEEDMAIFENNPELLAFTSSLDLTPLQH